MRLHDLLPADLRSSHNPNINRITMRAQDVQSGDLFCALPSASGKDIRPFIRMAIDNGASAIIVSSDLDVDHSLDVFVSSPNPASLVSYVAAQFYTKKPETIIAVTGTNGKSSVVNFVNQLWQHKGILGASIGTLGIHVNAEETYRDTGHTTPDILSVHQTLQTLNTSGVTHVALEASSHGLHQHRLHNLNICAAAFTNLSQDHLDYHKTFDAYFQAKAILFEEVLANDGVAVINLDDKYGKEMHDVCIKRGLKKIITIGENINADFGLVQITPHAEHQELTITYAGKSYQLNLPLVGRFQVYNALTACAIAMNSGLSLDEALSGVEELRQIPGRLEFVARTKTNARIYVDYAHTPDALLNVLTSLRENCTGKIHLVYGCGGDRDTTKRQPMAETANKLADFITITDDNPRHESPEAIRNELHAVSPDATNIGDRYQAIKSAIQNLKTNDILLVAGKGHETYQTYGDISNDFDDRAVVLELAEGV